MTLPSRVLWLLAFTPLAVLCTYAGGLALAAQRSEVETLTAVAALPAHVAGSFQQLSNCQQTAGGDYFIFDRRSHAVFVAPAGLESARKLITIGAEPGRLLDPSAFDLASDESFVVTDAPGGQPRVQVFLNTGSTVSVFRIPGRALPRITFGNLVLGGVAAVEYTGRSVFLSQPELGALIAEYSLDGRPLRTFGDLRKTGHEQDPGVHLAMNSGLVVANPAGGGFFFVFLAGVPQFRKYDSGGRLLFDRHVEGPELDELVQSLPTTWARRKAEEGDIPIVMPSLQAAAADAGGNLWIATAAGITYVYDSNGEKRRAVRFRGAGELSPAAMSFTPKGRLLLAPGCYAFETGRPRPGAVTPAL